ncbi:MAG: hypothetical protein LAO19_16600 [Acidobacteriia bacterium]|nr:hypothetical protein [Terriglobia bacterium]
MNRRVVEQGLKDRFFPIIARIIEDSQLETPGFVPRERILGQLMKEPEAKNRLGKTKAGNIIDWFSAHFTMHKHGDTRFLRWGPIFNQFERAEIEGQTAYKPISFNAIGIFPDEVNEKAGFLEGATRKVLVNAFERDPRACQRCIDVYGTNCFICGFSFGSVYGKVAEGFIHVHHLRELAEIRKEYLVDPIRDLRPVCPNCHAVLHCRKPAYSIEEVKKFLKVN